MEYRFVIIPFYLQYVPVKSADFVKSCPVPCRRMLSRSSLHLDVQLNVCMYSDYQLLDDIAHIERRAARRMNDDRRAQSHMRNLAQQ
jgi:hypothetical protein